MIDRICGCVLTALGVLTLLLPAHAALAQPNFIDFEQIPGMVNSPGSTVPVASRLADQYLASHGVRFSSGAAYVAVVVHGAPTPSGTRIIGGSTPDNRLTYQSNFPLVARFFDPTGTIPYAVSVVSVRGDLAPIPGTKTLEAYDAQGAFLGVDTQQDSSTAPLSVSAPGIHRVRIFSSSATVGFDDLRFDDPMPAACPADFNRDGFVDFFDFDDFVLAFEAGDPAADFNIDGFIDFFDFDDFVLAFETGC
jgi:hypothetical protein